MNNYEIAQAYIAALTGSPDSIMDWRCIADQDKAVAAHNFTGTLQELYPTLVQYNNSKWGVFCNINALDGHDRKLNNVAYIRAHVVDLDNPLTSQASYERAIHNSPIPTFAVQTSPGKFHVYWCVEPYVGNDFYTIHQRKLRQLYDGDKNVIDATRVLRVPGFYHNKGEPYLVTSWQLSGQLTTAATLQEVLNHVNVFDNFTSRFPLGEPSMAAPSLDWLRFAVASVDPNDMDRTEWLSFSAAIKQAGSSLTDEQTLHDIWAEWCDKYTANDRGENFKLWNSIKDTEVGWTSIERKTNVKAYMQFGFKDAPTINNGSMPVSHASDHGTQYQTDANNEFQSFNTGDVMVGYPIDKTRQSTQEIHSNQINTVPDSTAFDEILDPQDCKSWFQNCYFITRTGEIFSRAGRFMNSTKFNGLYGGKHFIITSTGKSTDEAWKAALRSTVYTIPKVDHVRFLPDKPLFHIEPDAMKRLGLNTYIPAQVEMYQGDVSLWLDHIDKILPDKADQKMFLDYLAHVVKYPGFKIPWAPMLQSAQGVGKTVFFDVMSYALGDMYVYSPKAPELVKSGSTFNAWMRGKLMIIVNEIKIDERRELIEILKPMITDARVEIQSKGVDQDMEDNPANWLFFSNYKDAIPINKSDRRYGIFYSVLQSAADIEAAGMGQEYFTRLFDWLRTGGGLQAIAYWLHHYPIERGAIPVRAPESTSHVEALRISRSPMEVIIADCVADELPGFRGGFVSVTMVLTRSRAAGLRNPSPRGVQSCLEGMGYVEIGRTDRPHAQEDMVNKPLIFAVLSSMKVDDYAHAQGYE